MVSVTFAQRTLIGLLVLTTCLINYQGFKWLDLWKHDNGAKLAAFRNGVNNINLNTMSNGEEQPPQKRRLNAPSHHQIEIHQNKKVHGSDQKLTKQEQNLRKEESEAFKQRAKEWLHELAQEGQGQPDDINNKQSKKKNKRLKLADLPSVAKIKSADSDHANTIKTDAESAPAQSHRRPKSPQAYQHHNTEPELDQDQTEEEPVHWKGAGAEPAPAPKKAHKSDQKKAGTDADAESSQSHQSHRKPKSPEAFQHHQTEEEPVHWHGAGAAPAPAPWAAKRKHKSDNDKNKDKNSSNKEKTPADPLPGAVPDAADSHRVAKSPQAYKHKADSNTQETNEQEKPRQEQDDNRQQPEPNVGDKQSHRIAKSPQSYKHNKEEPTEPAPEKKEKDVPVEDKEEHKDTATEEPKSKSNDKKSKADKKSKDKKSQEKDDNKKKDDDDKPSDQRKSNDKQSKGDKNSKDKDKKKSQANKKSKEEKKGNKKEDDKASDQSSKNDESSSKKLKSDKKNAATTTTTDAPQTTTTDAPPTTTTTVAPPASDASAADTTTTTTSPTAPDHSKMVVDILSIGSKFLPDLQKAQQETFGSHHNVRIFYAAREGDDIDPECHSKLTNDQIVQISRFCRKEQPPEEGDFKVRRHTREKLLKEVKYPWLFDIQRHFAGEKKLLEKGSPAGWLCAQKRPISALAKLMRRYRAEWLDLPDYLFIIDDDTYINIDNVLTYLQQNNPPNQLNAVAGCLYSMRDENMSLPYGGFGTILSKESLRHALRPLKCDDTNKEEAAKKDSGKDKDGKKDNDKKKKKGKDKDKQTEPPMASSVTDFGNFACQRIKENRVNEQHLFHNGMNLVELFESYAKHQRFRDIDNWTEAGFCFHSDTFLGYLVNTYELGRKEPDHKVTKVVPVNHFQTYEDSVFYYGNGSPRKEKTGNRCFHVKYNCNVESHICHYLPPHRMQGLWRKSRGDVTNGNGPVINQPDMKAVGLPATATAKDD